ncbi:MAG TPA: 2-oxo-4-hydroxy-4-carboxy-5-ureidoimidazoline decarboxylase [Ignavibacteria bacterium]|nr:2-oxo-4-hydroxy-4-carboxy-5-ureidoimidazoline decarboxylase [Ignavibacteria bacterium]
MEINLKQELMKCCGSEKWAEKMSECGKFTSEEEIYETSEKIWSSLDKLDWLEAFSHHPKIGDIKSLKEKYSSTKSLAEKEQSGVRSASVETLRELAELNEQFEKKFGYIFIVCATGKSAEEMLEIIKQRISNDNEAELLNAMKEQGKITILRLKKIKEILL